TILSLWFSISLTRRLLNRLGGEPGEIAEIVQEVARGNLTVRFESRRRKETGVFLAMKQMVSTLEDMVRDIRRGVDAVTLGSRELTRTAQRLAEGATEQASSAEEVAASMEEMNSNITNNADSANETEKIAQK